GPAIRMLGPARPPRPVAQPKRRTGSTPMPAAPALRLFAPRRKPIGLVLIVLTVRLMGLQRELIGLGFALVVLKLRLVARYPGPTALALRLIDPRCEPIGLVLVLVLLRLRLIIRHPGPTGPEPRSPPRAIAMPGVITQGQNLIGSVRGLSALVLRLRG